MVRSWEECRVGGAVIRIYYVGEKSIFNKRRGEEKIFLSLVEDLDLVPNTHVVIHNNL